MKWAICFPPLIFLKLPAAATSFSQLSKKLSPRTKFVWKGITRLHSLAYTYLCISISIYVYKYKYSTDKLFTSIRNSMIHAWWTKSFGLRLAFWYGKYLCSNAKESFHVIKIAIFCTFLHVVLLVHLLFHPCFYVSQLLECPQLLQLHFPSMF